MPRRPRSQLPDGFFHITARGVAQSTIFLDQLHYATFIDIFETTGARFGWNCYRYCVMPNHYHLIIETLRPRLSRGMHRLNGRYAQWFNEMHDRVGHVFQNRFGAYVIEGGRHFEQACAYVDANPVRAGRPVRTARGLALVERRRTGRERLGAGGHGSALHGSERRRPRAQR